MLVDWFTVLAQVINFFVLVWLLKRFLFKPIVSAMDAREHITEPLEVEQPGGSIGARAAQEHMIGLMLAQHVVDQVG